MDDKLFQWVKKYYHDNRIIKDVTYPTNIQSSTTLSTSSDKSSLSTSSSSSSSQSCFHHFEIKKINNCQNEIENNAKGLKNSKNDNFLDLTDSAEILIKEDMKIDFERKKEMKKTVLYNSQDEKKEFYPKDTILPLFFQHQGHSRTIVGKEKLHLYKQNYFFQ